MGKIRCGIGRLRGGDRCGGRQQGQANDRLNSGRKPHGSQDSRSGQRANFISLRDGVGKKSYRLDVMGYGKVAEYVTSSFYQ